MTGAGARFCLASVFQRYLTAAVAGPGVALCPTTIVWGDADRSHARTDKATSRELATAPTIVHVADVGHFPELEAPARFAALLGQLTA